jgi:hypothetical protein
LIFVTAFLIVVGNSLSSKTLFVRKRALVSAHCGDFVISIAAKVHFPCGKIATLKGRERCNFYADNITVHIRLNAGHNSWFGWLYQFWKIYVKGAAQK